MEQELPLRDIHLPPPISWWPPAPGWWLLAVLIIALLVLLAWLWRRHRRERAVRRLALAALADIERSPAGPQAQLQDLAILLRRTCLSVYPRAQVAGLTGVAWLDFLDQALGTAGFAGGMGQMLAEDAYRPQIQGDLRPLFALCRRWLKAMPKHVRSMRGRTPA